MHAPMAMLVSESEKNETSPHDDPVKIRSQLLDDPVEAFPLADLEHWSFDDEAKSAKLPATGMDTFLSRSSNAWQEKEPEAEEEKDEEPEAADDEPPAAAATKTSSSPTTPAESEKEDGPGAIKKAGGGGSKWSEFTVERWRSGVYVNETYFGDLYRDTIGFIGGIAEHVAFGQGRGVSLVEVGCGTGEFVRGVTDSFCTVVGLDFNPNFIGFCKENTPPEHRGKVRFIHGDACELPRLLRKEFPKLRPATYNPSPTLDSPKGAQQGRNERLEFWGDVRVVACVGNTIGIVPQEVRDKAYAQMVEAMGPDGILVMVYWNARWFGDACQNFYHANPQLCGPFTGASVDFDTTTLTTPSGYRSHWTGVKEAREVIEGLGLEIVSLKEKGKGVLVAARRY